MKSMEERFLKSTYLDKGVRFSVSTLCKPSYQLWVINNIPDTVEKAPSQSVGFKSAIGSAWHEFCEKSNEPGVIKEFTYVTEHQGVSIGGTADEVVYVDGKWQLRDHKTKGVYSAKKFLGIGTKANPTPLPENQKEIMQMSIYRWLFKDLFDIQDTAIIYLWVLGHTSREKFPETSEVPLKLKSLKDTEKYINSKIKVAKQKKEPECDCDTSWLCNYCEVAEFCPKQKHLHDPFT